MGDDKEILKPSASQTEVKDSNKSYERKLFLWGGILYQQALSLLDKYLPDALPQEPTELWVSGFPGYRAKYRGKHYIAGIENFKGVRDMERIIERMRHMNDQDWVEPPYEPEDWNQPERLLEGTSQYSTRSWGGVYLLVHELIHQRQAEINPSCFPVLSDSEEVPDEDFINRIMETHKTWSRNIGKSSLFDPVIEGMAILGSYYVMSRFLDDLVKEGDVVTADKVRKARNEGIRRDITRKPESEYTINPYDPYKEGVEIMRKLYKHFGIDDTPKILASVDLKACQGITKGSLEYQQMVKNPVLLPGLQTV